MVASTGACDVGTARPTSAACASDMRVGLASPAGASERGTTPATVGCSGPSLDPGLAGWLAGRLRSRSRPPGPQKLHCTRGGTAVTAGTQAGAGASENRQDHVHARGERGEQAEPVNHWPAPASARRTRASRVLCAQRPSGLLALGAVDSLLTRPAPAEGSADQMSADGAQVPWGGANWPRSTQLKTG